MFSREMINSITGPVVQRDRDWRYEPGDEWYGENARPDPGAIPDSPDDTPSSSNGFVTSIAGNSGGNVSNVSGGSSEKSNWSIVAGKKKRRTVKRGDNMPPIDIKHLANLTDYAQVYAKLEQPEWRRNLLKKHGPLGIEKKGYTDFSAKLWVVRPLTRVRGRNGAR